MKKHQIIQIIITIVVSLFLIVPATPVLGFQYLGYHWDANQTYYNTSSLPDEWIWAVYMAATEWNSAGADFRILGSDTSGNTLTSGYYGDENWLAETSVYGYPHIYEVDTVFNTRYTWYTDGNQYDVQSSATHEFGHWLMLWHTSYSNAIMYQYYNGERDLTQDDIDGIIYIYGEE